MYDAGLLMPQHIVHLLNYDMTPTQAVSITKITAEASCGW